jgi:hypothetical protein
MTMRIAGVVVMTALLSGAALAQSSSPPMAPPMAPAPATSEPPTAPSPAPAAAAPATTPAPDGISRDDYIAKARAAAEKRAAAHFDEMDANHDGILTKAEIAAYHAHHKKGDEAPQ